MTRSSFYAVTFTDSFGVSQVGRIFASIKNARKGAADVAKFGTNVRIMKGGPGGIEVK